MLWFIKKRRKKIFKKKIFKKKIFILQDILLHNTNLYYIRQTYNIFIGKTKGMLYIYKKYMYDRFYTYKPFGSFHQNVLLGQKNFLIILSQKSQNIKCTFMHTNVISTFTTGTILKYFNINLLAKHLRKDIKGTRMFLNFMQLLLEKKYVRYLQKSTILFNIVGFNHSMINLKKNIKDIILSIKYSDEEVFSIFKIKVSFTKVKCKRFKSIKKRLKKNILSNFLKKVKLKL